MNDENDLEMNDEDDTSGSFSGSISLNNIGIMSGSYGWSYNNNLTKTASTISANNISIGTSALEELSHIGQISFDPKSNKTFVYIGNGVWEELNSGTSENANPKRQYE